MMQDKSKLVQSIFSDVAPSYDLMNDLMSFGLHHCWKDKFVGLFPNYTGSLLDVAGGTCDIALRYYHKSRKTSPNITVCDINPQMLAKGKDKIIDLNILSGIDFMLGDAQALPFGDMSFDYYSISFGIRNVSNIELALAEAYRILKPGGKFMCLEFSKPTSSIFNKIYDNYSDKLIPLIGKVITQNKGAYQYLVDSIRAFPKQEAFAQMIKDAGFAHVDYMNLTNGIVAIHYGYKI